ncbi:MAG: hypothetical protein EOO27_28285, partial [Comamonadaceae bacterium]
MIQHACLSAGWRPKELEQLADQAKERFDRANQAANDEVRLWEPGISNEERFLRRARAREQVAAYRSDATAAHDIAERAFRDWRIRLVRELLAPTAPASLKEALSSQSLIPFSALPKLIYDSLHPDSDPADDDDAVLREIDIHAISGKLRMSVDKGTLVARLPGSGIGAQFVRGAALDRLCVRGDELCSVVAIEWPQAAGYQEARSAAERQMTEQEVAEVAEYVKHWPTVDFDADFWFGRRLSAQEAALLLS